MALQVDFSGKQEVEPDFQVELFSDKLPFEDKIFRVRNASVLLCLKGSLTIEVNMKLYVIEGNTFLSLFPGYIVHPLEKTEDFKAMYFTLSSSIYEDALFRFPPEFFTFLKREIYYQDTEEDVKKQIRKFETLKIAFDDMENVCRREILLNLVRVYYLDLYNSIYKFLIRTPVKKVRKIEIFEHFVKDVREDFMHYREVSFFANKIGISAKYLSVVVQEFSGRNAKKWIDDYVTSEIKIRLHSTNQSLQDMAFELNFADQSFLNKFFKRQTGISPTAYRKRAM